MSDLIPLMTTNDGANLVAKYFGDSDFIRIPLIRHLKLNGSAQPSSKFWIDPCIDGCVDLAKKKMSAEKNNQVKDWLTFMGEFSQFEKFGDPSFLLKPVQADVDEFVQSVMNKCASLHPAGITVPQLPVCDGSGRNKINRSLAMATGKWKSSHSFSGKLILPLVFTHQEHLNGKPNRNPKVKLAEQCYHESQSDGIWVVDSSLVDDNGSPTLRNKRFPNVISLHEELNERIHSQFRIAGPYWGLNLVLWAKSLIDNPVIGVGSGYKYYLSGGMANTPTTRIAIPSLRRRVKVGTKLNKWIDACIAILGTSHPVYREFEELRDGITLLNDAPRAKEQVAKFYKDWFVAMAKVPKPGRSMAMFQDLSAAYALGKSLPALEDEETARRPESVAESLMLSCL